MSEKIKKINKEEIGEYKVPNDGNVWEANWTDDISALSNKKSALKFEFFGDEDDYVSPYSMSGEAANKVLRFGEDDRFKAFGEKNARFRKELKMVGSLKDSTKRYGESLRKAA